MGVTEEDLTPREGKCLRHVVMTNSKPVMPARLVIKIEWSDLPRNVLQARSVLERLRASKLVERRSDGYWPTKAGEELIRRANKKGIWNQ